MIDKHVFERESNAHVPQLPSKVPATRPQYAMRRPTDPSRKISIQRVRDAVGQAEFIVCRWFGRNPNPPPYRIILMIFCYESKNMNCYQSRYIIYLVCITIFTIARRRRGSETSESTISRRDRRKTDPKDKKKPRLSARADVP